MYVENLCVSGPGRTRLAKSVHDAGWSAFVHMLEYKAARHGRTFARTGRRDPTSQVCSACGTKGRPRNRCMSVPGPARRAERCMTGT